MMQKGDPSQQQRALLRICMSCEWIYSGHRDCPKCGWPSYGAHFIYGKKAYKYKTTQEPWLKNQISKLKDQVTKDLKL